MGNGRRNRQRGGGNGGGARRPAEAPKLAWFCKKCVSPTTQGPWKNAGSLMHCSKCKVHKGQCRGSTELSPPPRAGQAGQARGGAQTQTKEQKLQKLVDELRAEVKAAKGNPDGNKENDADGKAADAEGGKKAEDLQELQTQLRTVQQILASLPPEAQAPAGTAEYRASLESQKEALQGRIRDSKDPWQRQKALLGTIEST